VGGKIKAGKKDAGVNLIANTDLTTWVPPTSTPAEVRQDRRELHEKLDVLPFADGPASSTRINADSSGRDSDDEPLNSWAIASYSYLHFLLNCFKHKQQAIQPNNSALLACQYAHVDLLLDVGSGIPSRYIFCLCFLPPTLDPALCFRFKNEFSTSALFCFLLNSRALLSPPAHRGWCLVQAPRWGAAHAGGAAWGSQIGKI
jgi:hypothetical protein